MRGACRPCLKGLIFLLRRPSSHMHPTIRLVIPCGRRAWSCAPPVHGPEDPRPGAPPPQAPREPQEHKRIEGRRRNALRSRTLSEHGLRITSSSPVGATSAVSASDIGAVVKEAAPVKPMRAEPAAMRAQPRSAHFFGLRHAKASIGVGTQRPCGACKETGQRVNDRRRNAMGDSPRRQGRKKRRGGRRCPRITVGGGGAPVAAPARPPLPARTKVVSVRSQASWSWTATVRRAPNMEATMPSWPSMPTGPMVTPIAPPAS